MKRTAFVFLTIWLLFSISACGNKENTHVNMQEIYNNMLSAEKMPDMVLIPVEKGELLFGVPADACVQEFLAVCQDSMRADEIWLVEAKDSSSAEKIEVLVKARIEQKASELKDYLPEQFQVVQKAQIIRKGENIALIISPVAEKLAKLFQ